MSQNFDNYFCRVFKKLNVNNREKSIKSYPFFFHKIYTKASIKIIEKRFPQ